MEQDKAVRILKALADGVDPATGEQFPVDSPYQQPDVVRALFSVIQLAEETARTSKPANGHKAPPENAGRPWSQEEDIHLGQAYETGKPIAELAREYRRSRGAIEARLVRLGKVVLSPPSYAPRPKPGAVASAHN